jgi:Holliday junction resolvase
LIQEDYINVVNAKTTQNQKKMLNANKKGKRFELQVAKYLSKEFETSIRRTPNSGGLSIKGDIMATQGILSEFNWECKNQEKLNIWKALEQSRNDCIGSHKEPLVVFTKNFEKDYVALELKDFVQLLLELEQLRNGK